MSDSGDDWEAQLDSDNEKKEEKKVNNFDDEDKVDPEKVA